MVCCPGTGSKEALFPVLEDCPGLGRWKPGSYSYFCPVWVAQGVLTQFPLLHPVISWGLARAPILRCEVWDLLAGGGALLYRGVLGPQLEGLTRVWALNRAWSLGGGNQNGEETRN